MQTKYSVSQIELDNDDSYEEELQSYNEKKIEGVTKQNRTTPLYLQSLWKMW